MVILYTTPGCASCRKAKQWLKDNQIEFKEKNIFNTLLDAEEIKYILSRSENGTEDIISVRSKAFQALKRDIEDLSLNELVELIQNNPSILKRPIMLSKKNLVVGYDDDEITTMLPSALRNIVNSACGQTCPNYVLCGSLRCEPEQSKEIKTA
ncbi:MAG: transcriptional regulator Spx [Holdemanella sp.]|nr:transcriptional regulator Spx [Holdemanella sp.]